MYIYGSIMKFIMKFLIVESLLLFISAAQGFNMKSYVPYKELSFKEYQQYINEQQWYNPACIFFNGGTFLQNYTNGLEMFNAKLEDKNMTLFIAPKQVSSDKLEFSCYVKQKSPIYFKGKHIFKRKQMEKFITSKLNIDLLQMAVAKDIHFENIVRRESKTIMVFLPGNKWFQSECNLLELILEFEQPNLQLVFVPPNTNVERETVPYFQVSEFPCVLILTRQYSQQKFKLFKSFHGPYQATDVFLKLHFFLQSLAAVSPNQDQLDQMMNSRISLTTLLVCIFTSSNSSSFNFLHAYQRSMVHFKSKYPEILFVAADIADRQISIVLMRNLKVYNVDNLPFIVAFWNEEISGNQVTKQKVITSQIAPTPHNLEVLLNGHGLLKMDKITARKVCSVNETEVSYFNEQVIEMVAPIFERQKNITKVKKKRQPEFITEKTWYQVFNQQNKQLPIEEFVRSSRLIFIIFIQSGCSFCNLSMPVFKKVLRSQKFLNSTSVYLMNCSENRQICLKYSITGYPTMILFRVLTLNSHSPCFENNYQSEVTSVDYHGDVEFKPIMSWLSKMSQENLNLVAGKHNIPVELVKDVRLIAQFYTKKYILKYIPRSLHGRLMPFKCFMDLCELLFNQVECFGTQANDVEFSNKKKELFLESLFFTRKDGLNVTIFQTGLPMKHSLDADHFGKGIPFHVTHKYDISRHFKCEDNTIKCNEVALKFIREHSRLPVTYLTSALFHSHQKGMSYLWEKPVLVAFAHTDNITQGSKFLEKLYELSLDIYTDINVAVVDVDIYPHWSSLFVPKDFYTADRDQEDFDELYQYPRFCMIELGKHNRAAFYPPLKINEHDRSTLHTLKHEDMQVSLKNFVQLYLKNKEAFLVETRLF
ncbi:uncharacterized protein LOC105845492 isoform X1 [Hydra vulgaris]|uniref:uncharacterized protein LOC105845492 isoform X1 n=1 Tax=Hydra vulgaris TaxID=6087 RepID=UPI001F5E95B8|nr:uncharacterized protein LOC105845492 isoform X1 [Hydra vulgaris]XP_047123200.1 uncharacterized protein LOC105845492 isoform X1 [Hydra vulgaris]